MSQINVNTIKDKSGLGAPNFPNGVNATGVITATSFSGDGGNLTGIDASSLKVGGTTKVQATTTGLVITGIATASNFKTGSTNVHDVGVEAAGINVLGGDTPIGAGATIYNAGGAVFTGVVTATSFSGSGNINASTLTGTLQTAAQPNITSVGTLSSLNVTGNVSVGATLTYEDVTNVDSVGLITARSGINISDTTQSSSTTTGALKVAGGAGIVKNLHVGGTSTFSGALDINAGVNISGLGDFAASTFNNVRAGWSGDGEIDTSSGNLTLDSAGGTVVVDDNLTVNGTITGNLSGNATSSDTIDTTLSNNDVTHYLTFVDTNGSTQGETLRIYSNITCNPVQGKITATSFSGNGVSLTNLAAGNIASGIVATARLGSGTANGSSFLRGDQTWATLNNNAITNGAGYITSSGISGGFSAGNASNLNSGTVPSARLGSSGTRSSSTYLRGDNTWVDDGCFIRADAADMASGDITFNGGAGAVTIANGSDIRFTNGSWTGEHAGKIQMNSNYLYLQGGSSGFTFRSNAGTDRWYIDSSGHLTPGSNSNYNIGQSNVRPANIYADNFYGNGANLTGITGTTINNNADNRLITGSGTANTLTGESDLTWDGTNLDITDSKMIRLGTGNDMTLQWDGSQGWIRGVRYIRPDNNNDGVTMTSGGDVRLFYNNALKLATTSGGVSITGTVSDSKGNVRSVPYKNEGGSYTLVAADAGKCITHSSTITVPNGVFAAGDVVTLINNTGSNQQITQGSSLTMRNTGDDGSTGNVSVKTYAMTTIYFTSSGTCWFSTTNKA